MSDESLEALYPCIGVCMADPLSGLCQGCGRPLAEPDEGPLGDELEAKAVVSPAERPS